MAPGFFVDELTAPLIAGAQATCCRLPCTNYTDSNKHFPKLFFLLKCSVADFASS